MAEKPEMISKVRADGSERHEETEAAYAAAEEEGRLSELGAGGTGVGTAGYTGSAATADWMDYAIPAALVGVPALIAGYLFMRRR